MYNDSKIIKELVFLNNDGKFLKNNYAYITYGNNESTLLTSEEEVIALKDYAKYTKIKSITNIFDNIKTSHIDFDDFKNNPKYKDKIAEINDEIDIKNKMMTRKLMTKYDIDFKELKYLDRFNDLNSKEKDVFNETLDTIKSELDIKCKKYKVQYSNNPNEIITKVINTLSEDEGCVTVEELSKYPEEFIDNCYSLYTALGSVGYEHKKNLKAWIEFTIDHIMMVCKAYPMLIN